MLGPKNDFPKFAFLGRKKFLCKKVTNIQIVTHPYLGRLSKNVLEVFHDDIANLARAESEYLKLAIFGPFGHFTHPVWPKIYAKPKNSQQDFCSLVHCPSTPN